MAFRKTLFLSVIAVCGFALFFLLRNWQENFANLNNLVQGQNFVSANISNQLAQISFADPSALNSKPITLIFAGDIMLSRAVGQKIQKTKDSNFPFLKIAETIRSADFAFANLENPISDRGANQGSIYSFRADPETAIGLESAGFDAVSVANNHIWDWGSKALLDTINILNELDIIPLGAGENFESANAPRFFTIHNTRLAFLAFTTLYPKSLEAGTNSIGISDPDPENIRHQIAIAKTKADLVIVSLHWGEEYQAHSNQTQQKLAREIIDAGANLVIGHHPHVIQEVEEYHGGYIFYSLGNFVFDQNFSEATRRGALAQIKIKNRRIISAESIPVHINDQFQPEIHALLTK